MWKIPNETCEILKIAFGVYTCFETKEIKFKVNDYSFNEHYFILKKIDKQVLSLFLACLLNNTDIKKLLDLENITLAEVKKFFGLLDVPVWPILESDFRQYFLDFEVLINKIANFPHDKYEEFTIDKLYVGLLSERKCDSTVLKYFYQQTGRDYFKSYLVAKKNWNDKKLEALDLRYEKLEDEMAELESLPFQREKKTEMGSNILQKKLSYIERYGKFLTNENYVSMPAIKREKEIKRLMIVLLTDSSALLVGESGVGKTAIVEGLAYYIQNGLVPDYLKNKKIVKLNIASLLSNTVYRGQFEEKVEHLIEELRNNPDIILFIDEIHNAIGAGSSSNSTFDLANMLKPYLDRGELKIIGATTIEEYDDYILRDTAFRRRFDKIDVLEPSCEDVEIIIKESLVKFINKYQIPFVDDDKLLDIIYLLAFNTDFENRNQEDSLNNPALVLKLIDLAFAYAVFNNHEKVYVEDIIEALKTTSMLESSTLDKLIANLNKIDGEPKAKQKIIKFPKY